MGQTGIESGAAGDGGDIRRQGVAAEAGSGGGSAGGGVPGAAASSVSLVDQGDDVDQFRGCVGDYGGGDPQLRDRGEIRATKHISRQERQERQERTTGTALRRRAAGWRRRRRRQRSRRP